MSSHSLEVYKSHRYHQMSDPDPEFMALFNGKDFIAHPTSVSVKSMTQLIFTRSVRRKAQHHQLTDAQVLKVVQKGDAVQHANSVLCTHDGVSARLVPHETHHNKYIIVDLYRKASTL